MGRARGTGLPGEPGNTAGTLSRGKPASEDGRKRNRRSQERQQPITVKPGGEDREGNELRTSSVTEATFSVKLITGRVKGELDQVAIEVWTEREGEDPVKLDEFNYDRKGETFHASDVQAWMGKIDAQIGQLVTVESRKQLKVKA